MIYKKLFRIKANKLANNHPCKIMFYVQWNFQISQKVEDLIDLNFIKAKLLVRDIYLVKLINCMSFNKKF